ncbi:MAG: hypothetical protein EF806_05965 [Candidatus Methanoliparum thermophilum]|uniref:TraB family protein n=1 Tax=Methanoliparum thermophilum TaxID=2491083 RepID=A0A520KQU4_METT2|nr:hypothetical protein [Candidatus Methanoliparum sp. LAM-1]RZN63967.1 MAG: hypothetical protein EF806_05965 [Candidatus Methanoliparum thermophilum]
MLVNIAVPYASTFFSLILLPILFAIISVIPPLFPSFMTPEGMKIARESAKFFPQYYSISYERKENFMSDKIAQICKDHDRVVVITGLVHIDGLEEEIREKVPQARIKKIPFLSLYEPEHEPGRGQRALSRKKKRKRKVLVGRDHHQR